jgi:hypothetical protein
LLTSMRFPTVSKLLLNTFTVKVTSGFARDIDSTSVKSNPVFSVLGLYFGLYSSAGYQTCAGNRYYLFSAYHYQKYFSAQPSSSIAKINLFFGRRLIFTRDLFRSHGVARARGVRCKKLCQLVSRLLEGNLHLAKLTDFDQN